MTLRAFIISMFFATAICWIAFSIILFNVNPYDAGPLIFLFFYFSLFLAMLGTLTLIGILTRISILKRDDYVARRVMTSFRQGAFLSGAAVSGLFLMSRDLLTWWNIALFIVGILLLEFFFISLKRA